MSVSIVLLFLVGSNLHLAAASTPCDYRTILDGGYNIVTSDELYCFDSTSRTINQWSPKCSDDDALRQPRDQDMGFACETGTLVGYTQYDCDSSTGALGTEVTADSTLTVYTSCVQDSSLVCSAANVPSDPNSKLHVDPSYNIQAVDLVGNDTAGNDTTGNNGGDPVVYPLACDDGYGFESSVDMVYGYCSGTDDSNVNTYTVHPAVADSGCYAMCPANPTSLDVTPDNLQRVDIGTAQRSGSVTSASVVCSSGFMIAHNAPATYEFRCTGTLEGAANSGVYSCVGDCPVCVPACPAIYSSGNYDLSSISNTDDVPNLTVVEISDTVASGATVTATVECDSGFAVGANAPQNYEFTCAATEANDSFSAQYTMTAELAVCAPMCSKDNYVTIANAQTTVISDGGILGDKVSGTVVCKDKFSHGYDVSDEFDFTCSEGSEYIANGGEFGCGDEACPECFPICEIPDNDTTLTYSLADGKDIKPFGGKIPKGQNIIEVACKNESLNLAGVRFYSCKDDGTLGHTGKKDPTCDDSPVCTHPKVKNGKVSTFNNLKVGEKYEVICDAAHYFDVKTATEYGDGTKKSFYEIKVECLGEQFSEFVCHHGCLAPDFQGSTFPDMSTEDSAPYKAGAVVKFECLDNQAIVDGQAEATCDAGTIPSPVCGACSLTISTLLLLLTALLL